MSRKKFDLIKPTLVLFLICVFCSLFLAMTNQVTAPVIEELARQTENAARQEVLPEAQNYETLQAEAGQTALKALNASGEVVGYIFVTRGKGYGGDIPVMTGISTEGKITGIKILELNETAGLGMRAANPEFQAQYKDANAPVTVVKSTPKENEIQALTGATITSNGVSSAVNQAFALYDALKGVQK